MFLVIRLDGGLMNVLKQVLKSCFIPEMTHAVHVLFSWLSMYVHVQTKQKVLHTCKHA